MRILKILYLLFICMEVFSSNENNLNKLKQIISKNRFYNCDEDDLMSLRLGDYYLLKSIHPGEAEIVLLDENIIKISSGVGAIFIENPEVKVQGEVIYVSGYCGSATHFDLFYISIEIYNDYIVYSTESASEKTYLYFTDKDIDLRQNIIKQFNSYWLSRLSTYAGAIKNVELYEIYPVVKRESGWIVKKLANYIGLYKNREPIVILELSADKIVEHKDLKGRLVIGGVVVID